MGRRADRGLENPWRIAPDRLVVLSFRPVSPCSCSPVPKSPKAFGTSGTPWTLPTRFSVRANGTKAKNAKTVRTGLGRQAGFVDTRRFHGSSRGSDPAAYRDDGLAIRKSAFPDRAPIRKRLVSREARSSTLLLTDRNVASVSRCGRVAGDRARFAGTLRFSSDEQIQLEGPPSCWSSRAAAIQLAGAGISLKTSVDEPRFLRKRHLTCY